ncbi:MAG: bacteriohemerythrin [Treponema sp.]|jgi:hemerythrin|nr:bacteriohemerythrin [Treponema sp.]
MATKDTVKEDDGILVSWSENYVTGIKMVDDQHKELVNLTNHLYKACLTSEAAVEYVFKDAMVRMVDYVRFHFSAELELLERIHYPEYHSHKKQHDQLVKQILEAAEEYNAGRKFIPHVFVRTLKDWVFSHIAISDMMYAGYVAEQKKLGLLSDAQING